VFGVSAEVRDGKTLDDVERAIYAEMEKLREQEIPAEELQKVKNNFAAGEFRMGGGHFAIEQEGDVSVKFFLQLVQPFIRFIPRPWFVHRQEDLIGLSVEREKVDHGWVNNPALYLLFALLAIIHQTRTSNAQRPTSNAECQKSRQPLGMT
jgi:hypothetical protein